MADIYSVHKRSDIMSRIRSQRTTPELRLQALVTELVDRRRKIAFNDRSLPGTPDVHIPSLKLTIFVDGCFFHACPQHGHIPKSNRAYWRRKIQRNVRRDQRERRRLRGMGVAVWRVWEHDLKPSRISQTKKRLARRLERRKAEFS